MVVSPVATENTCTECVQRSHPKNGLREKWCFHAHLNSHGKGKGVNTWDIYIYTMEMGDDASTMVQLRKNNILLNYLSFLSRKITTMPYLPVWWASFNEWTEWYTSLHNSFWWGVSEIQSPSYSYTARRMLVVDKWSQARWYASLRWSLRVIRGFGIKSGQPSFSLFLSFFFFLFCNCYHHVACIYMISNLATSVPKCLSLINPLHKILR